MHSCLIFIRQAGTANAFIPLIEELQKQYWNIKVIACKAASAILASAKVEHSLFVDEADIIQLMKTFRPERLLTGTSFEVLADEQIWSSARELNIVTYAFVDQWCNIHQRFIGINSWPDNIWVIDEISKERLSIMAPVTTQLIITSSPVFNKIEWHNQSDLKKRRNIAVFVSQPFSESNRLLNYGYDQQDSFISTLRFISGLRDELNKTWELFILLHPLDDEAKWTQWLMQLQTPVPWSFLGKGNKDFVFQNARIVCGLTSVFLAECSVAGLPVVSFQLKKNNDIDSYGIDHMASIVKIFDNNFNSADLLQSADAASLILTSLKNRNSTLLMIDSLNGKKDE